MTDKIRLLGITFYGHHGVTEAERALGRPFQVDVEISLDLSTAGETDDLGTTVDYAAVCQTVREVNEEGPYLLLETLADRIARRIARRFPIREVTVRVRKPNPPVGLVVEAAEVEITRSA